MCNELLSTFGRQSSWSPAMQSLITVLRCIYIISAAFGAMPP